MKTQTMTTKERYTALNNVNAIMIQVYDKLKHTQSPTKRIATEFKKVEEKYLVHYEVTSWGSVNIKIWGNGLDYDNAAYFCFSLSKGWQGLAEEIERQDCHDYIEQLEEEEKHYAKLSKLQEKLEAVRKEAEELCPKITPKSAKLRSDSCHWDDWSYTTKKAFPILFDYKS